MKPGNNNLQIALLPMIRKESIKKNKQIEFK